MAIPAIPDEEGEVSPRGPNFALNYSLAVASATCAESVTYPLDVIKTRMQIAGEVNVTCTVTCAPVEKQGMLRTGLGILRNEGVVSGLWRGLSPAIYRHMIYAGVRLSLYEKLRDDVFGKEPDGTYPLHKAAMTAFIVGGIAQVAANPMDLVKVQIQMEGKRRLEGKPVRVKGVFEALANIWREAGVKGLWRGWAPNTQRGALVNLGDIATYDCAKRLILQHTNMKDGIELHAISSFMAGFSATALAAPAEVVSARMMNQPTQDGKPLYYKNSMDCLRKTVGNEGFFALYKGFMPLWMKLGPASLTFWVALEFFRKQVGVSSF